MKKIGVVITDGVGFRNFILSDFMSHLEKKANQVVIFSCLPAKLIEDHVNNCTIIELEVYPDRFQTWFFMKLKEIAHLKLNMKGNFGIRYNYNRIKPKGWSNRAIASRFIYFITQFFHSEKWIQRFNSWQRGTFKNHSITKSYIQILENNPVEKLFFTHQRPPYIAPMILAANKKNIPTATFIFSWDNLASKGRMAGNFDEYLVWSELMRSELMQFYPSIKNDQIHIVGTPQFEPFVLERYASSADYLEQRFGLNIENPIVLYSCGDVSTSQNDPLYIETLAKAISSKELPENCQLIVRTSPAETAERFKHLINDYPLIKWNKPEWPLARNKHQEIWSQRVPTMRDMKDLRALLEYCDLAVNMCSTMSLDAMIFDKPVINPVFGTGENGLYDDRRYLKYQHYERVARSGAVVIVKDENELISEVKDVLRQPNSRRAQQKELLKLQISKELSGTSERFVDQLLSN